jgi:hypothetical protein
MAGPDPMPYYECPVCGGGYVIDPAPPHPVCDRDGAALKRASEASYEPGPPEAERESRPKKKEPRRSAAKK